MFSSLVFKGHYFNSIKIKFLKCAHQSGEITFKSGFLYLAKVIVSNQNLKYPYPLNQTPQYSPPPPKKKDKQILTMFFTFLNYKSLAQSLSYFKNKTPKVKRQTQNHQSALYSVSQHHQHTAKQKAQASSKTQSQGVILHPMYLATKKAHLVKLPPQILNSRK